MVKPNSSPRMSTTGTHSWERVAPTQHHQRRETLQGCRHAALQPLNAAPVAALQHRHTWGPVIEHNHSPWGALATRITGCSRCCSSITQSCLLRAACLGPQGTILSASQPRRPVNTARPTSKKPMPAKHKAAWDRGRAGAQGLNVGKAAGKGNSQGGLMYWGKGAKRLVLFHL